MPKSKILCYVKQLLNDKGLTQEWLAEATKIDAADLSRIAHGKRTPRLPAARRIARALGVNIDAVWPDTVPKRHK